MKQEQSSPQYIISQLQCDNNKTTFSNLQKPLQKIEDLSNNSANLPQYSPSEIFPFLSQQTPSIYPFHYLLLAQAQKPNNDISCKIEAEQPHPMQLDTSLRTPRPKSKYPCKAYDCSSSEEERVERKAKNFRRLGWSNEEKRKYLKFVRRNRELFELTTIEKIKLRVNVMISEKVTTRSPQQCHSHHQKLIKKYGSIEAVITQLSDELAASAVQETAKKDK